MDKHLNEQEINGDLQVVIEEETVPLNEQAFLGASEDNWIGRLCRRNVALQPMQYSKRLLPLEKPYKLAEREAPARVKNGFIMLNWSNEEILITIYFVARCIRPKSVQGLLLRRGYDRSLAAIERTIICTTKQYPYLKFANGQWDLSAIDRWMKDFVRSQESVNKLTRFSLEDAEDMVLKISVDDLLETMDNLGLDFTDPAFNART